MNWRNGYIAVDWGTTNRRAYRIDDHGQLVGQFEDERGVMAVPQGEFGRAAAEIRAHLGDLPMLLAGMVGSNRGWREAPYAACPVGMDALARSILWVEEGRTGIVAGASQRGPAGADVMRGEEVQALGAVAGGMVGPDTLICQPGTHAKWIVMTEGRIVGFRTMMTGEIFAVLRQHSILADQLAAEVGPGEAFRSGVAESLAGADLLSGLFRIRARHLLGEGDGNEASFASGLLIGCDVRAGLQLDDARSVSLIGRPDLCALYAVAIALAGRETTRTDGARAFLAGIHGLVEML